MVSELVGAGRTFRAVPKPLVARCGHMIDHLDVAGADRDVLGWLACGGLSGLRRSPGRPDRRSDRVLVLRREVAVRARRPASITDGGPAVHPARTGSSRGSDSTDHRALARARGWTLDTT